MNFRNKRKKARVDVEDVDITSLLDILVILLVFLLKSFNDSELTVDIANELALPYSMSRVAAHDGVILQVNKKRNVFVNNDIVGNMNNPKTYIKMKSMLEKEYENRFSKKKKEKKSKELINFVFDKGLKYADINKVMDLSSDVGFNQYKLIIQGEE